MNIGRFCSSLLLSALTSGVARSQDSTGSADPKSSRRGDVEFVLRNRAFFIPEQVQPGLTIQPTFAIRWMATDLLRFTLDAQTVDNSGPGRQGAYQVSRTVPGGGSGNFLQEITLEGEFRFWQNAARTRSMTVSGSGSRSIRSYFAHDSISGRTFGGNRRGIVPAFALAASQTHSWGETAVSAVVLSLPDDDALYLRAIPGERERFGVVAGPQFDANVKLGPALSFWGRAFIPVSGNNTIDRESGRPARAVPYDAGFRLRLNPALDAELFASNALGNTGALGFIPDREYRAIGAGLRIRPNSRFARSGIPVGARTGSAPSGSPAVALASLTSARLSRGTGLIRLRGGGQGVLGSAEFAPVQALQLGAFVDYLRATRDEGELGAIARLNLYERIGRYPVRMGVLVAASRTNNPLVNLLAGRWDELERLGLPKGGFRFGDENEREGRLYVVTAALPVEGDISPRTTVRAAPIAGYVQRWGLQLSGLAAGIEQQLRPALVLALESGVAVGRGNVLTSRGRERAVPFAVALAWSPGAKGGDTPKHGVAIDAYVTNRAGDSPFHMLRVRAGNGLSGGIGVRAAFP